MLGALAAEDESLLGLLAELGAVTGRMQPRYELNHRPDWVRVPVAGILRLLEQELA